MACLSNILSETRSPQNLDWGSVLGIVWVGDISYRNTALKWREPRSVAKPQLKPTAMDVDGSLQIEVLLFLDATISLAVEQACVYEIPE